MATKKRCRGKPAIKWMSEPVSTGVSHETCSNLKVIFPEAKER